MKKKYQIEDYKKILKEKYPNVDYKNIKIDINLDPRATKIIINCDNHGENEWRWQNLNKGVNQLGCKKCLNISKERNKLNNILNSKNYKIVDGIYLNSKSSLKVLCLKHNLEFKLNRNDFINDKNNCPSCNKEKQNLKNKQKFINKSIKIHNGFYTYENVKYKTIMDKVVITCPIHGDFKQTPDAHTNGQKCPECRASFIENYIKELLDKNGIKYVFNKGHKLLINPETNYPLKPDFWLEKYNLIIEYDGIQHFKQIYSNETFLKTKKLDELKNKLCKKNKIKIWRFNKSNLFLLENKLKKLKIKKTINGINII